MAHSPNLPEAVHRAAAERPWVVTSPAKQGNTFNGEHRAQAASRILIVDRDPMSGDLLVASLARHSHLHASTVSSADLLQTLGRNHIDIVVISFELAQHSKTGLDLAQAVSREHPDIMIIILLNHCAQDDVINSFRSGARGVFSRENSLVEFINCVEHVSKGFIWAGSKEAGILLDAFRSIPAPAPNATNTLPLTGRELQVVRCAAKGKTNRVIASELGLSEHTIKNYLFRAFEKLGVSNRVELLFYLTLRGQGMGPETAGDAKEAVSPERLELPGA